MIRLIISSVILFGVLLFVSSCQEEESYIIPQDKMIDILVDVHLADGILNTESYPYDVLALRPENFYKNILSKHQINRVLFDSALSQYSKNRTLYISMYEKVIEKLRIKQSYIEAEANDNLSNITHKDMFYYSYSTDYENIIGLTTKVILTKKKSRSGKKSYQIKGETFVQTYSSIMTSPLEEVEFKVKCFVKFDEIQETYPSLYVGIEKDGKSLSSQYINIKKFINTEIEWNEINTIVKLSLKTPESKVKLSTYFFNNKKQSFYLDDYSIEIKQVK